MRSFFVIVPHLHPFSWSMDYFNTINVEQTNLEVGFHNLMNILKLLTFRVKTFQFLRNTVTDCLFNCITKFSGLFQ